MKAKSEGFWRRQWPCNPLESICPWCTSGPYEAAAESTNLTLTLSRKWSKKSWFMIMEGSAQSYKFKVILIPLLHLKGIGHCELLPQGQTINQHIDRGPAVFATLCTRESARASDSSWPRTTLLRWSKLPFNPTLLWMGNMFIIVDCNGVHLQCTVS